MNNHSRTWAARLFAAGLLLLTLPAVVQAQFNYTTNNGTITITGYTGPGGAVVIPATIDGLPVTSIGELAFFNRTTLASVTIPNSITSIGPDAFAFCGLTDVSIPNAVTSIGYSAFYRCASLSSVTIGNSVTSIGGGAFESCTGLSSVTIPNSVTNIGQFAFDQCTSLSAITVDAVNFFYSSLNGVLFNKSQTVLIQYPAGKAGSYAIPQSVTSIGGDGFAFCTRLTSVTIPNSLTSIGDSAFWGCTRLTGVYFQGSAPSVGSEMFVEATNTIIYYLPGTTGWGETFAGRPAVLWNPLVETVDASFGVRTNRFGFTITGASNLVLVVEAATNLAHPVWVPVSTNTLTGGASYFSDPEWTNHQARFYRLRSP